MTKYIASGLTMIQTKYLACTNTRGSRIKAWCQAGSITVGYPHELTDLACHHFVAEALIAKLGLDWQIKDGGWLPNNAGAAFVLKGR